jgi:MarR family transcriptional regulator, temperature-dependent positive regulator of motility
MNNMPEHEVNYKILKLLSTEPNLSQRAISGRMGISLGKTNYVLAELAEKGIIKIKRFKTASNKTPYTYMLTPHGLEEKARITLKFLKRKLSEYEEIKHQIKEITKESKKDNAGTITSEQPANL